MHPIHGAHTYKQAHTGRKEGREKKEEEGREGKKEGEGKLKVKLPYNPAILFLVMYPKAWRVRIQTDVCTLLFIKVLFKTAKR